MEHKDFYNTQSDLLNIIAILSSNDLIDYYMDLEEPEIIPKGARRKNERNNMGYNRNRRRHNRN